MEPLISFVSFEKVDADVVVLLSDVVGEVSAALLDRMAERRMAHRARARMEEDGDGEDTSLSILGKFFVR